MAKTPQIPERPRKGRFSGLRTVAGHLQEGDNALTAGLTRFARRGPQGPFRLTGRPQIPERPGMGRFSGLRTVTGYSQEEATPQPLQDGPAKSPRAERKHTLSQDSGHWSPGPGPSPEKPGRKPLIQDFHTGGGKPPFRAWGLDTEYSRTGDE